jgi:hypothetical protein
MIIKWSSVVVVVVTEMVRAIDTATAFMHTVMRMVFALVISA